MPDVANCPLTTHLDAPLARRKLPRRTKTTCSPTSTYLSTFTFTARIGSSLSQPPFPPLPPLAAS